MTIFMSLRSSSVGGSAIDPVYYQGDGDVAPLALKGLTAAAMSAKTKSMDVLFATHGFNVDLAAGACALGRLEQALALPSSALFVGVLWPGDFWLPVVNYPFEGAVAIDCGRRVARACDTTFRSAASLNFVTHSLGARVALEAAKNIRSRKARTACLTAAAINDDCLTQKYKAAFANIAVVSLLASREDKVLRLAFPIGDAIGEILDPDHTAFTPALGYCGPPAAMGATKPPWQIPDGCDYDHGDYLPPSDPQGKFPDPGARWNRTADFMRRAFLSQAQSWP